MPAGGLNDDVLRVGAAVGRRLRKPGGSVDLLIRAKGDRVS
ncbi:hypothetical protein [Sphingomonas sp. Leaf67]|nr:hypothetical protein [Sphingomonas sp. Leaf67]